MRHQRRSAQRLAMMMIDNRSLRWRLVAAWLCTERVRRMAYVAFDTLDTNRLPDQTMVTITAPLPVPAPSKLEMVKTATDLARDAGSRLGPLEWSVVALARRDTLSSLRAPGLLSTTMRTIFRHNNPRLADERLEALRRMAVLAWHHSFQVPSSELRAFFDAGFTVGQYEAMMGSIAAARAKEHRRR
jgi:hypothetical protein